MIFVYDVFKHHRFSVINHSAIKSTSHLFRYNEIDYFEPAKITAEAKPIQMQSQQEVQHQKHYTKVLLNADRISSLDYAIP